MIVVKVELHSGVTGGVTQLGEMHISNNCDHPEHPKRGNYTAEIMRKGASYSVLRKGHVKDFPRQAYNVWRLVFRALRATFPEERGPKAETLAKESLELKDP